MPRRKRLSPIGIPQHIVQRGNNRQVCFSANKDFAAYAHWLQVGSEKYGVQIHAWVLMDNHVHLLVTPDEKQACSKMMQFIGRNYVRYFNYAHKRSGTLWEGRFHSCLIEEENYLLNCQRYIELNPVRANIVDDPKLYHWSSYQTNALGTASNILTPHPLYLALGKSKIQRMENYKSLFESQIETDLLLDIRLSLKAGLVLGDESFRSEIEKLTAQRLEPRKRGPKPR